MAATRPPLVLYSTNTSLAYNLNQPYYGEKHWVWCSPYFDEQAARAAGAIAPPRFVMPRGRHASRV
jgi:hypothetical protein